MPLNYACALTEQLHASRAWGGMTVPSLRCDLVTQNVPAVSPAWQLILSFFDGTPCYAANAIQLKCEQASRAPKGNVARADLAHVRGKFKYALSVLN